MSIRRSDAPELWQRVRSGDPEAFVVLYEELADAVFGFCLRRAGSWGDAEDVTSLVFLEAWRPRSTLRQEASGKAWLFGVANNVCRNSTRARRRHTALLRRLPLNDVDEGFEIDSAQRLDAKHRVTRVLDALARIPASERDVVTLATWSDLTTADIARVLEIPPGTVKSRLARARRRLAEMSDELAPSSAAQIGSSLSPLGTQEGCHEPT